MEVDGCVQVALGFFLGKSFQNRIGVFFNFAKPLTPRDRRGNNDDHHAVFE